MIVLDEVTFLAFALCVSKLVCVLTEGRLLASPMDVVALVAHALGIVFFVGMGAICHLTLFAISSTDESGFTLTINHNFGQGLSCTLLDTLV